MNRERQPPGGEISRLLAAWHAGEQEASERLFTVVYGELRRLAAYHLRRERPGHTLQTTALVHEAYLRLVGQDRVAWQSRGHFFAIAAQAMRRILVDHARRRRAAKRGGEGARSPLDSLVLAVDDSIDLLELDVALDKLELLEPREARVVELRFFAGMSIPDVAFALGVSESTVERDWVDSTGLAAPRADAGRARLTRPTLRRCSGRPVIGAGARQEKKRPANPLGTRGP